MECNMCGDCCRVFLINLTESEYRSGTYQTIFQEYGFIDDFEKVTEIGANFLAKNLDESCIYLKDNKCSIHTTRPQVCRPFCCDSTDFQFKGMIDEIKRFRALDH
jgi:Fe-S-cluster containining protein